jgi:hypothetical protein
MIVLVQGFHIHFLCPVSRMKSEILALQGDGVWHPVCATLVSSQISLPYDMHTAGTLVLQPSEL